MLARQLCRHSSRAQTKAHKGPRSDKMPQKGQRLVVDFGACAGTSQSAVTHRVALVQLQQQLLLLGAMHLLECGVACTALCMLAVPCCSATAVLACGCLHGWLLVGSRCQAHGARGVLSCVMLLRWCCQHGGCVAGIGGGCVVRPSCWLCQQRCFAVSAALPCRSHVCSPVGMSALHLQPWGPACKTPSSEEDAAPLAAVMGVGQVCQY